jgi:hypothetical protein
MIAKRTVKVEEKKLLFKAFRNLPVPHWSVEKKSKQKQKTRGQVYEMYQPIPISAIVGFVLSSYPPLGLITFSQKGLRNAKNVADSA